MKQTLSYLLQYRHQRQLCLSISSIGIPPTSKPTADISNMAFDITTKETSIFRLYHKLQCAQSSQSRRILHLHPVCHYSLESEHKFGVLHNSIEESTARPEALVNEPNCILRQSRRFLAFHPFSSSPVPYCNRIALALAATMKPKIYLRLRTVVRDAASFTSLNISTNSTSISADDDLSHCTSTNPSSETRYSRRQNRRLFSLLLKNLLQPLNSAIRKGDRGRLGRLRDHCGYRRRKHLQCCDTRRRL